MPEHAVRRVGKRVVTLVEDFGLVVVLIATIVASYQEVMHLFHTGKVHLADLLLLFIYLEVVAMVAAYWESGQLPVRMPLYIGMVALARYLTLDMKNMEPWQLVAVAVAILLLGLAVLAIRFGHVKLPYQPERRPD